MIQERLAKDDFRRGQVGYEDRKGAVRKLPVPEGVPASVYMKAHRAIKAWTVGQFEEVTKAAK